MRYLIVIAFCLAAGVAGAQTQARPDSLYEEISRMDSLLFRAFNTRDLEALKRFLDPSLEVYQDNTGLRDFRQTLAAFADLFSRDYVLERQLVPGSMEVYPVKDYGAIQTGRHTFCHTENGRRDCGTYKFLHIWKRDGTQWRITRLVTYDH